VYPSGTRIGDKSGKYRGGLVGSRVVADVENIACPLCGNESRFLDVRVSRRDDSIRNYGALYEGMAVSRWKICGRCGFVHQNPRPSISALNAFYLAGSYHTKIDTPPDVLFADHAPYYADEIEFAIERSGLRTGKVFDIGCGLGVALKSFKDRGWQCYGTEPDRGRFEYARDHYGLDRVRLGILDGQFEPECKVDLVFTHHAFEHFADLHDVMQAITRVLEPGGYMFTAIPTFVENRSRMSRMWMNSAHYSLFTHRSFNQLLAHYGFEEVAHRYHPWRAGPDQFGHLARFTGVKSAPEQFFEDPERIARYLSVVNPVRSALYMPFIGGYYGYGHLLRRATNFARAAGRVLVEEPDQFIGKAVAYMRRKT
jgi:SAM-dependent methyltransferase